MLSSPVMTGRREKFRRGRISGILWFGGLLAALYVYWLVMVNLVIPDFFDPPYALKCEYLRERIAQYPGHPLWLIMGSSRVAYGLRPELLTGRLNEKDAPLVYNFGMSGVGLFRQYICLNRVLHDGFHPQRVGIEIFAADLTRELFSTAEAPSLIVRARRYELGDYLRYSSTPPDFTGIWMRSRWDPADKYGMLMEHQTRNWRLLPLPGMRRMEGNAYDEWGWVHNIDNTTSGESYRAQFAVNKERYEDEFAHFEVAPNASLVLRKYLDTCREHGIGAFLVKMPESEDFRALHTATGDAALASFLADIQADYKVPLIDASAWVAREGFSDGHHLNGVGGAEFTRRLGDELYKTFNVPLVH